MRFVILFALFAAVLQTTMSAPLLKRSDVQPDKKDNTKEKCIWSISCSVGYGGFPLSIGSPFIISPAFAFSSYAYNSLNYYSNSFGIGNYGGLWLKDSDAKAKEAKTKTA